MSLSYSQKITFIFSIIFIGVVIIAVITFRNNKSIHKSEYLVQHTREVLFQSGEVQSSVQDAVLNARGYVITGDSSFLQPLSNLNISISEHIKSLKNLTKDNGSQQLRIDTLIKLITKRIDFSRLTIEARRQNGLYEAQRLITTNKGENFMKEIEGIIDRIQEEENSLLTARQQALNKDFDTFDRSFVFLFSIITLLIIIVFFTIKHNSRIRKKAEAELKKSNELFYNLFEHNPAIIAISRLSDGKLTNVNSSFLRKYGFTSKEEVINKSASELKILARPEQRKEITRMLEADKIVQDVEVNVITRQGQDIYFSTSVLLLEVDHELCLFSVSIDISDRKKAENQLKEVNKELEAFTYSVSHDMRAPLRIINGYTDILTTEYHHLFDDEGKRIAAVIVANAKRMGQLIDDMLNFSRLGRVELNKYLVNMNQLVTSVVHEQQSLSNYAKAEIKIGELSSANCDYNLIQQVWINLISNALKYSSNEEKPLIEIGSFITSNEIIFYIKDNGTGFNMQYAHKLFEVFERLHKLTEFEGTGVGLALVHRIITRHEGKVWAEAEVDKGATFYFSLPL